MKSIREPLGRYGLFYNVTGVTTLLKDRKTGVLTTARKQIKHGDYDPQRNMALEVTPYR